MKRLATFGILLIILGIGLSEKQELSKLYNKYILNIPETIEVEKNEYYRNYKFEYVQPTTNFSPTNEQDIINIFYTAINSGQETFTFYCPEEYTNCINEVAQLADDQTALSHINNFVHPYNGFKHIETEYDNLGRVTITIQKSYTTKDIEVLEKKIDEIEKEIILPTYTLEEKIKVIHNYIINNSKYDSERSDLGIVNYKSDIAYGTLIEGYGLCGGYTDAMQLFLERLNIENYKVSSNNHIWNAVKLNNNWYHLDLTWDDPITQNNVNILEHNFFLISTNQLLTLESDQHIFDTTIYKELKEA